MIAPTPLSGKVWESHGQWAVSEASSGLRELHNLLRVGFGWAA
jgi:hypothetical protein